MGWDGVDRIVEDRIGWRDGGIRVDRLETASSSSSSCYHCYCCG